ncbi:MAG: metallophosphoesterase [Paludibacter sp.]|nr:metallophosphoesterase [Paludibacter sp.]
MILQYASDLHLEFPENKDYLNMHPIIPVGEVMILAGDIVPFAILDKHEDFFSYLSDHFKTTYWIPGNHEYYHSDLASKNGTLNEKIRPNVFLVNNISVMQDHVELIFSTLWSKISPKHERLLEQAMNDFRLIRNDQKQFTAQQLNAINAENVSFLRQELVKEKTGKRVVVTHHVPTFKNVPVKYKGNILHEAFGVELYELIEKYGPDYWIYGHVHRNNVPFEIGETTLVTNQLGYVKKVEHTMFKTTKTITV